MVGCWTLEIGEVIDTCDTCIILVLVLTGIMIIIIFTLIVRVIGDTFQMSSKKEKTPSFDGEMKKSQDVEAWLLAMKRFF